MRDNNVKTKTDNHFIFRKFFKKKHKVRVIKDDFIMSPKVDFAFKELMKNEIVRIGFLSAVLDIPPETIKSTQLLDTNLRKRYEDDKLGILDVCVCMNDDTEIDIEIQIVKIEEWAERSVFYLSKMYAEHVKKGKKYDTAHKCISISVLDFVLFPEYEGYYSGFHIWEDNRRELYTDKIEFHIIELPKLINRGSHRRTGEKMMEPETEDLRALWGQFMNAKSKEEFAMIAKKNSFLNEAFKHLQMISFSERKRREYDARERLRMDHAAYMKQREEDRKQREEDRKERERIEKERKNLEEEQKKLEKEQEKMEKERKERDEKWQERDNELKERESKLKEKEKLLEELKEQLEAKLR